MTTFTIQAVYQGGVLQPKTKLNLPDNTPVQVQVTPLPLDNAATNSLFGLFPELAMLGDDDFAWAKRLWEHSLERQSSRLDDLTLA
jgi:predicted DNA-binding antitoxin AbrB/MazE fold protein